MKEKSNLAFLIISGVLGLLILISIQKERRYIRFEESSRIAKLERRVGMLEMRFLYPSGGSSND